ncbi:MAG: pyruvate kinase [Desulfobacterales bacterium]|nr:pyruvate kinase [Desulfobacterales bacterium]
MTLPASKTKIVCTIGPASNTPAMLEKMINAGMNIARLNFSHGEFPDHKTVIENIRAASRTTGKRVAIMGDLPGPKMRIGKLDDEPFELEAGDTFTLTSENITGNRERVSMSFSPLPGVVKPGDSLFLNDGIIHLEVFRVDGNDVECRVVVGGELRSRKGLNLPGIDLGISAFTDRDHACLKFAMENGVDAVSQSFVETAADIEALRKAAKELGHEPFIIAKIERSGALKHIDQILQATDGIMIARGDLGVEIPIEEMAVVQKNLMQKAVVAGKPVITATQMLESMVDHNRPTRAEATDVANAILDGTDCVMLSGESAMGKFPVESVAMLSNIAKATEPHRSGYRRKEVLEKYGRDGNVGFTDLIALSVELTLQRATAAAVVVPTVSGATAQNVSRFRLPVWVMAVSPRNETCQSLQFSYGVHPVFEPEYPHDWNAFSRDLLQSYSLKGDLLVLTEGPSSKNPNANHRMELIDLKKMKENDE